MKAALDSAEKEKGSALTEQEEISLINREIKQTNQSLDGAKTAGRDDLIEKENAKLALLKAFLPEQLSEEQIEEKLRAAGVNADTAMGDAMKLAKSLLNGQADGATLSKVVKAILSK